MMSYLYTYENNGLQTKYSFILRHNSIADSQLFDVFQQVISSVADKLKSHTLCLEYPFFPLTETWSYWRLVRQCHSLVSDGRFRYQ